MTQRDAMIEAWVRLGFPREQALEAMKRAERFSGITHASQIQIPFGTEEEVIARLVKKQAEINESIEKDPVGFARELIKDTIKRHSKN